MPSIVPEENRVGIAGLTDARFRAADYGGSGLEALGAGLVKIGGGGEELAKAIDERHRRALLAASELGDDHQRNIDDAAVKKAYVAHSDRADLALRGVDGLLNRRGVDAYTGFPDAVQRLAESHDQALAPLTEAQRGIAATILADRLRSDIAVAGSHVHQQGAFEQRAQNDRVQEVAARNAVANLDDPALHDHHMTIGENAVRQQALNEDMPDDERDRQVADYRSSVYAASIAALAARQPRQAAAWYAGVGGVLNAPDRRRAEAALMAASLGISPIGESAGAAGEAGEQGLDAVPIQPSITPATSDDVGMPGAEDIAGGIRGAPGPGSSTLPPAPATPQAIPVPAGKFARNWPLLTPGQPDVATGNETRGPNRRRYADGWYDPEHQRANPQGVKYRYHPHYGVDFKSKIGDNVYAAAAGRVMTSGYDPKGWGYYVTVASPDGYVELYGHLSPFKLAEFAANREIVQGQVLGTVGNTGNASDKGDHLHFEVRRSNGSATLGRGSVYQGSTVDPLAWLRGELPDTRIVGLRESPYLPLAAPAAGNGKKAKTSARAPASRRPSAK